MHIPLKNKYASPKMGLWSSTALVMGNMIGAGIFTLPTLLAVYGGISLLGWLLTVSGVMLLAFTFSKLSKLLPFSSGPYSYACKSFGNFAGFIVAWLYWISVWVGNAAIAISLSGYLTIFFPVLINPLYANLVAVMTVWILTFINIESIKLVASIQIITTILKIIPLLTIIILGWFFIDYKNFIPFNLSQQSHFSAIIAVASLTLWTFIGIESATVPSHLIDNPKRNIPRATIIGGILTAVIYVLSTTLILGIIPHSKLIISSAPFADAMQPMLGKIGYYFIAGCIVVSCIGALNGWILIQGQVSMSAANDGLFPKIFNQLNKKNIPEKGIVISSILITMLITLHFNKKTIHLYKLFSLLSTFTTLIPYLFCALGLLLIIKKKETFF